LGDGQVNIDTSVQIGSLTLDAPVMMASGTAGYGTEMAPFVDLSALGAIVTKSLAPYEWAGNPAPRLHPTPQGMMNAVGLQGPGIEYWLDRVLPPLIDTGATVICSIWGRSLEDYQLAAEMLGDAPPEVVAVEVNLSCPNVEGRGSIFAHDIELSRNVIAATAACGRPRWAKLSANTDRIIDVARAVHEAGAEAVTCVNTLLGLAYDPVTLATTLGAGGGGYSGRAMHPVAVRAVHDIHAALPDLPVIGVGGVASGWDAVEMFLAGASAVQVGTATFADPRAAANVQRELVKWARERGIRRIGDLSALV
jgi:dihydroorotate dehydrogenase (NAD+) catalytic subunit|tara:strand:- start:905 stop:1831 length:927 start_codon:yes stop_codon:yes gene_type:complete